MIFLSEVKFGFTGKTHWFQAIAALQRDRKEYILPPGPKFPDSGCEILRKAEPWLITGQLLTPLGLEPADGQEGEL